MVLAPDLAEGIEFPDCCGRACRRERSAVGNRLHSFSLFQALPQSHLNKP